jgi:hypothetical protein
MDDYFFKLILKKGRKLKKLIIALAEKKTKNFYLC